MSQQQLNIILNCMPYRARRNWLILPNKLLDGLTPQESINVGNIRQAVHAAQHDLQVLQRNPRAAARMSLPRAPVKHRESVRSRRRS